jgi:hypothetical protein
VKLVSRVWEGSPHQYLSACWGIKELPCLHIQRRRRYINPALDTPDWTTNSPEVVAWKAVASDLENYPMGTNSAFRDQLAASEQSLRERITSNTDLASRAAWYFKDQTFNNRLEALQHLEVWMALNAKEA